MRTLVTVIALLASAVAHAEPIRVTLECEQPGRTKACPAFLLGFVDANRVFLESPRAAADVIVYASATEVALVDRMHLRFVSTLRGAPREIEIDVDLDSRADDDTQRGQLQPAFLRGMALFVASRFPKLVTVELGTPEAVEAIAKDTSPWDLRLELGGFGNKTGPYESLNGWSALGVGWIEKQSRAEIEVSANGGLNRQPPIVLEDGTEISVNSKMWHLSTGTKAAWLLSPSLSLGAAVDAWREDPKGQFRYGVDGKAGVEWDRYAADDPRGNRLAVMYALGYQVDRYNLRNVLGERFTHYPLHVLVASGRVRKDKIGFGLSLSVGGELIHPERRHHVSASPSVEWQIGDHIDINLSFSITKRELPPPDETLIDPTDYEQLSRLSYAEPLSMNGSFNLTLHWDRTNGARNDRFDDL